jgi:hypothetical protein
VVVAYRDDGTDITALQLWQDNGTGYDSIDLDFLDGQPQEDGLHLRAIDYQVTPLCHTNPGATCNKILLASVDHDNHVRITVFQTHVGNLEFIASVGHDDITTDRTGPRINILRMSDETPAGQPHRFVVAFR